MKRLAQAAAALAVAALLVAMASQCPFLRLPRSFPGAAWFQFSCRYTVLFQFAMAVLAAIGFAIVEREAREKQRHIQVIDERAAVPAAPGCRCQPLFAGTALRVLHKRWLTPFRPRVPTGRRVVAAVRGPGRDGPDQPGRGRGRIDLAIGSPSGVAAADPRGTLVDGGRGAAGGRRLAGRPRRPGGPVPFHGRRSGLLRLGCGARRGHRVLVVGCRRRRSCGTGGERPRPWVHGARHRCPHRASAVRTVPTPSGSLLGAGGVPGLVADDGDAVSAPAKSLDYFRLPALRGFHAVGPSRPFDRGHCRSPPGDENWVQVPIPSAGTAG